MKTSAGYPPSTYWRIEYLVHVNNVSPFTTVMMQQMFSLQLVIVLLFWGVFLPLIFQDRWTMRQENWGPTVRDARGNQTYNPQTWTAPPEHVARTQPTAPSAPRVGSLKVSIVRRRKRCSCASRRLKTAKVDHIWARWLLFKWPLRVWSTAAGLLQNLHPIVIRLRGLVWI